MLNPFPIQFLALLAYLLLRIAVSVFLLVFATRQYKALMEQPTPRYHTWYLLIGIELVLAILLFAGAYTQYTALGVIALGVLTLSLNVKGGRTLLIPSSAAFLLIAIGLSLFITGAGALAVDLPI